MFSIVDARCQLLELYFGKFSFDSINKMILVSKIQKSRDADGGSGDGDLKKVSVSDLLSIF